MGFGDNVPRMDRPRPHKPRCRWSPHVHAPARRMHPRTRQPGTRLGRRGERPVGSVPEQRHYPARPRSSSPEPSIGCAPIRFSTHWRTSAEARATDVAVHTWDLARTLHVDEQLDPRLVDHALQHFIDAETSSSSPARWRRHQDQRTPPSPRRSGFSGSPGATPEHRRPNAASRSRQSQHLGTGHANDDGPNGPDSCPLTAGWVAARDVRERSDPRRGNHRPKAHRRRSWRRWSTAAQPDEFDDPVGLAW